MTIADNAPGLGAAVVGLGVGEQHARAYAAHPAIGALWLHDRDTEQAQAVAQRLPGARVASSFEAMIAEPAVQMVSIASFDDDHFGQVVAALSAGKHVFVEKPLCRTLEELRRIHALWAGAGGRLRLGSNLILRAAPLYGWLKRQIAAGALGDLYAIDGDYLYGRIHKVTEGWRREVADYSVMQGGGIHLLDLMLWLTGRRPLSVTAAGNRISTAGTAFRYNDYCAATLQFDGGMIGRLSANYGCVHRHQHVLRVFGTRATFIYDDAGARLHESRDPAVPARRLQESPLPASKGDLIPGFIAAIVGNGDYAAETQSVFDGICVAIACDRAVASGQLEQVEYV
jgi:predicted dehydrogenase